MRNTSNNVEQAEATITHTRNIVQCNVIIYDSMRRARLVQCTVPGTTQTKKNIHMGRLHISIDHVTLFLFCVLHCLWIRFNRRIDFGLSSFLRCSDSISMAENDRSLIAFK